MSKIDGVVVVPEPTRERLSERQLVDYKTHRESLIRWLLTTGKDPSSGTGYAQGTVKPRAFRMDQFYRWVWDQSEYTTHFSVLATAAAATSVKKFLWLHIQSGTTESSSSRKVFASGRKTDSSISICSSFSIRLMTAELALFIAWLRQTPTTATGYYLLLSYNHKNYFFDKWEKSQTIETRLVDCHRGIVSCFHLTQ